MIASSLAYRPCKVLRTNVTCTIITMAEWSSMNRNGPAGVGDADTSHKTGLVPPLLRMFAPSRPIEYLKPMTSRRIKVHIFHIR